VRSVEELTFDDLRAAAARSIASSGRPPPFELAR
jgi:hypothetical protein